MEAEIRSVMAFLGCDRLQAYRHVQARHMIQRLARNAEQEGRRHAKG